MKERAALQTIEREALKDDHEWMGCCGIFKLLYKQTLGALLFVRLINRKHTC